MRASPTFDRPPNAPFLRCSSKSTADWNWWSTSVCKAGVTDLCETGFASKAPNNYRYDISTSKSVVGVLFNQSYTAGDTAYIQISYDPCVTTFPASLCTKPFKLLETIPAGPRIYARTNSWRASNDGKLDWKVYSTGSIWGWAVTWDN